MTDTPAMDEKGLAEFFRALRDNGAPLPFTKDARAAIAAYLAATARDGEAQARFRRQVTYSVDLQRIVEALCKGGEIPVPETSARFHYDMAVAHRSFLKASQEAEVVKARIIEFAQAILHGDDEHRGWLMQAALAFNAGDELPAPRGKGTTPQPSPDADGDAA